MQSIHQKLYSHLSFLLKTGGGRVANRQNCMCLVCAGMCVCVWVPACLRYVYVPRQILQISQHTVRQVNISGSVMSAAQERSLHWMALLWVFSKHQQQSIHVWCTVSKKRGNINFFALGNLNISRNDINTITTQTRPSLISSVTGLYPLAPVLQ